ncbi:Ribosomal_L37-domain-containing protein [Sphaerulina musiva SO2202]|uniref:Large ribosomal subunit protein mL54 n=1 Tax=Sphaerulina musiva (strain SO2202) TaxID=692275 RepID=N1QGH9_SPHMS|nr:Ribosomal_L37-domain-containing protein [Sphaerulina musiva SO2202]EMF16311.1 Ribosomal_L37-domain-containing protein [Sphaerulina musiva SO2202]
MICRRCMQRLARRPPHSHRTFSYTPPTRASPTASRQQEAQQPIHDDRQVPTSPTQSSTTPSSSSSPPPPKTKKTPAAAKNVLSSPSSVPAGTVLKGLNFLKNQQDPVALEDHEYPEWLWSALKRKGDVSGAGAAGAGDDEGDLFSKSKKQRRLAAKALKKQQLLNPESLAPKIPLYEQSIDLPGADGTIEGNKVAYQAQEELTRAMREKRRSKIKEDNFLREMR